MYTKTKIDTTAINAISVYTHNIDHDSARVNIQKAYIYIYQIITQTQSILSNLNKKYLINQRYLFNSVII